MKTGITHPLRFGCRLTALLRAAVCGCFVSVAAVSSPASAVIFNLINADGANEGFNDPTVYGSSTLGYARLTAVNYALGIWGNLLTPSYSGETINVRATFDPLGGGATSAGLAQAGPTLVYSDGSSVYFGPYANHYVGGDLDGGAYPEITAQFNSDVDNGTVLGSLDWYYGTDGNPGSDFDLVSVTLHEVMHGLGILSLYDHSIGNWLSLDFGGGPENLPSLFDNYLTTGLTGGTMLTAMTTTQRSAAAVSDDVYWAGANAIAANGGVRPKIYAPSLYAAGSSLGHLDEALYGSHLISPFFGPGEVLHSPSAVDLGMLQDIGWDIQAVPEPSSFALTAAVLGFAAYRRRKQVVKV